MENEIERSHENGIKITGTERSQLCTAKVWKNMIASCGHNGIVIQGKQCQPDVRGNVIKQNRKAGIKLTDLAVAHIGGTEKADIKFIPNANKLESSTNNTFLTAKKEAIRTFDMKSASGAMGNIETESMQRNLKNEQMADLNYKQITENVEMHVKSFENANVISNNYNQGILIVEGSHAEIIANKVEHNIKANIAMGGQNSKETRILYNYILNSKSGEGIFVVEGEDGLLIEDN